ncbi:hypothetical protein SG34_004335 [Thalassomonas viridans]|uniref:Uncharacterized protein n=1 Tax=Thalassomonas viridans TaxID=137584 RepID=A0AAE9Z6U0_9GAMM|nr:hypothetical protein [Thalassomonas viridans]WDE06167.1 hypothetical protein SG34_004335 [Thalassomonas viridans]
MSESNSTIPVDAATIKQLSSDCIRLSDDFNKFSEECAFLCDAFAAVAHDPDYISEETSKGIGHLSCWLKEQAKSYRDRIDKLHEGLFSLRPESSD